ncbi:anti-sigma factor domain-containing protein [Cohnella sp. GCM10027633]|uniref:anti-sigma factor n=1 Tax=unclassified Cohnella TaxID=2636738 RepID=UPI00362AC01F
MNGDKEKASPCDGLVDYVVGLGSDVERKRFERHLAACATCREEAASWREVWDRLAHDMDMVEPPADLKDEVLGPLLSSANAPEYRVESRSERNYKKPLMLTVGAAVLALFFAAGWLAADLRAEAKPISLSAGGSVEPTAIETLYRLSAVRESGRFEDRQRAYGVACFVRSASEERFVVYVFDSPATVGSEAYQVWLWHEGKRRSAGTFTVDDSGIGMMTYPLTEGSDPVDAIEVTLEPNPGSTSPRGPELFESYTNEIAES